jgi:2',3'-cyclic-nucleotide 2'-phosphodiesterase (5'-nucleotidase family)
MQARYGEKIAGKSRYAYVAGYLRALKAEQPTLVLDAGDDYEKGSIAELRSMGETTRRMIQALPIDARTVGNHDFAYGEAAVVRDVLGSAHPVLAANIRRGAERGPFAPFARIDVGCVKVGIVGLVTYNYGADDNPTKEPYDGVFHYDDRLWQTLDAQVKAHRAEVDVMIALTHLGFSVDAELARSVQGVDFIVGAHSEETLDRPPAIAHRNGVAYVMQAGHYARSIGRADVMIGADKKVTLEKYRIVAVDESLPVAQDVDELATRLEREAAPDAHAVIAKVDSELRPGKPMADLVWRAAKDQWGADALLIAKDVFWEVLPAGPVTLERLYNCVLVQREPAGTPGFSSLYFVDVGGAELAAWRHRLIVDRSRAAPGLATPPEYALYTPATMVAGKTYKVAVDKRALAFPNLALANTRMPSGRFAGELIDLLEAYARARTAKGLTL